MSRSSFSAERAEHAAGADPLCTDTKGQAAWLRGMTRTLDEAECTALERRLTVAIEAKDTAAVSIDERNEASVPLCVWSFSLCWPMVFFSSIMSACCARTSALSAERRSSSAARPGSIDQEHHTPRTCVAAAVGWGVGCTWGHGLRGLCAWMSPHRLR